MAENTPQDAPKKVPFWKKLTGKAAQKDNATTGSSLVESIVREAEKQAEEAGATKATKPEDEFDAEERTVRRHMNLANSTLAGVLIVSIASWAFFFAALHESNTVYDMFNAKNLTAVAAEKADTRDQLAQHAADTTMFVELMQAENLARRVLALPEPPTPQPVPAVPVLDDDGEPVLDDEGNVITQPGDEPEIIRSYRDVVRGLVAAGADVTVVDEMPDELATSIEHLTTRVQQINSFEHVFPGNDTVAAIASARGHAKDVLTTIKTENLKNIIADLKNQMHGMDTSELSADTRTFIDELTRIVGRSTYRDPNSIDRAIVQARALNSDVVSDPALYAQVISLIGTGSDTGDLAIAAAIARNLGRATLIAELDAGRISWSEVIGHVRRIASFGADLAPDGDIVYADSRRDISISDSDISFTGFAGKQERNVIEVRGQAQGESIYSDKNFTLLADLIDALEGSVYFRDVTGFTFSNNKNATGELFAPIGLKLTLQDPGQEHRDDAPRKETPKLNTVTTDNE